MLVFSRENYQKWRTCANPTVRFWIRAWEEGIFSGTHPNWTFSPFCLRALADLWSIFRHDQFAELQRLAIKFLASARREMPDGFLFEIPIVNANNNDWDLFFNLIDNNKTKIRDQIFELNNNNIGLEVQECNIQASVDLISNLCAELYYDGCSSDELLLRARGVFGKFGGAANEDAKNLEGLLDHLRKCPVREFIVKTEVILPDITRSKTLAPRKISHLSECGEFNGFVRMEESVFAISKNVSTHSASAVYAHRRALSRLLYEKSNNHRINNARLSSITQVFMVGDLAGPGWLHSITTRNFSAYVPDANYGRDAASYLEARENVEQDSVKAIVYLKDSFEARLGKKWWDVAARRYIHGLKKALARDILSGIVEFKEKHKGYDSLPPWISLFNNEGRCDFGLVANDVANSGEHGDILLAHRMRQIANPRRGVANRIILNQYLALAQGIRNVKVHQGAWPDGHDASVKYLAKLLLYVYSACFPRTI